ncbi:MAG: site-specific integrase [Thaumarchaeota archaeon]|nr:site-specific integrase [Nitrososphaerota archaeon]
MLRTQESYFEKISTQAIGTQRGIKQTISSFFSYCMEKGMGDPILLMKKSEEDCLDLLQGWINRNAQQQIAGSTIKHKFSQLNGFLHYMGIKMTPQDIRVNLKFPKIVKEEPYPLQLEEIQKILEHTNGKKKGLYLSLLSSGMRIGEAVQLRKKDFDLSKQRIMVRIPAKMTKTRTGRTTFISKEAASFIKTKLRSLDDDDLVFGSSELVENARMNEIVTLHRTLEKAGLNQKYEGLNRRKITLHSFRAYFFTKAARTIGEDYAHMLTGHGGYLPQYNRLTDDEKLELYLKLEPELLVYDSSRKAAEIEKLQAEVSEKEKLNDEIQRQGQYIDYLLSKDPEAKKFFKL